MTSQGVYIQSYLESKAKIIKLKRELCTLPISNRQLADWNAGLLNGGWQWWASSHCTLCLMAYLFLLLHSAHTNTHAYSGEECELMCRETNNEVVILPSNMSVESVLREHWRVPHKVRVSVVSVFSWLPPRSGRTDALHGAPRSAAALHGISRTPSTSRRNANSQSGALPVVPVLCKCLSWEHGNPSNSFTLFLVACV